VDVRPPSRAELYRAIERLIAERDELRAENARLRAEVERLAERSADLEAELAALRPGGPGRPAAGAPARPPRPEGRRKRRKKRAVNSARPRGVAAARVAHAVAACPGCGCVLKGGAVKRHREVIEVELRPAVVTEHVLLERVCPLCGKRCVPTLGPADGVVGQHRFGPTLLALIATWHEVGRMPVRPIQEQVATLFGVHVSLGAVAAALHEVAARGAGRVAAIRAEARAGAVVHADETAWWEDGHNRTLWVVSTPTARSFEIGRRTGEQIDAILGADFAGVLVTDFYAAYDHFGTHQRCWAHILRETRELVAAHPQDKELARWARRLVRLYRAARDTPGGPPDARRAARKRLEERTRRACQPFAQAAVPQRTLCARLLKHLHELFTFVTDPAVPPTNNQAERDLRPLVVARKVWGGTRSDRGSTDAARRFTLFRTWRARGLNPFVECRNLLLAPQV
jgi:transposase